MRRGNDAQKTCGALSCHFVQGRKEEGGRLELMKLERDKILVDGTEYYTITANETLTHMDRSTIGELFISIIQI